MMGFKALYVIVILLSRYRSDVAVLRKSFSWFQTCFRLAPDHEVWHCLGVIVTPFWQFSVSELLSRCHLYYHVLPLIILVYHYKFLKGCKAGPLLAFSTFVICASSFFHICLSTNSVKVTWQFFWTKLCSTDCVCNCCLI